MAELELNLSGLNCPLPILRTKKALADVPSGTMLRIIATDPAAPEDFAQFCRQTGHTLCLSMQEGAQFVFEIKRK